MPLLLTLLILPPATLAEQSRPPNFVLIFTDDQGYWGIGVYGVTGFRTLNLDRMAAEGIRFTDFYVAAPVCSTRYVKVASMSARWSSSRPTTAPPFGLGRGVAIG